MNDTQALPDTLSKLLSSKPAKFGSIPTQVDASMLKPENILPIIRLSYPNRVRATSFCINVKYGDIDIGRGCKVGIIKKVDDCITIIKLKAGSELEALKYCTDNIKNIVLIFNIDTKKILYCADKDAEEELKKMFIDHWNQNWKHQSAQMEFPLQLLKDF